MPIQVAPRVRRSPLSLARAQISSTAPTINIHQWLINRAAGGMYYDHFGQGIVNSFDQNGSFGLTTALTNPAGSFSTDNSPRFTGVHNLPSVRTCALETTVQYPYTPPTDANCGFAITWGIDDHLKTPYSETVDFSIQREVPGGFSSLIWLNRSTWWIPPRGWTTAGPALCCHRT